MREFLKGFGIVIGVTVVIVGVIGSFLGATFGTAILADTTVEGEASFFVGAVIGSVLWVAVVSGIHTAIDAKNKKNK